LPVYGNLTSAILSVPGPIEVPHGDGAESFIDVTGSIHRCSKMNSCIDLHYSGVGGGVRNRYTLEHGERLITDEIVLAKAAHFR
jgi:hypothetical protein